MSKPNSEEYVNFTIALLKDFQIIITEEQRAEMLSFLSQEQVNRYKIKLIKRSFGND